MDSLRVSWSRLLALFRKRKLEQELAEEVRSHLEMLIEENRRKGMTPEEARYAALRSFGGAEQVKEIYREQRGLPMIETLIQDTRYGLRQLRRSPGFTIVAVLTLALGIGANTAIFSLIDAVMLRTLPVEKPKELMQVQYGERDWSGSGFSNPLWEQVRGRQDVFSGAFAWHTDKFDLARGGAVHLADGIWVSGDFFNTLRLRPAAGRLISTADDQHGCPAVAVLSYGFWQDHYGKAASAVGSTLSLNSRLFEVIGVAPTGFFGMNVGEKFDVAVPICAVAIFDGKRAGWTVGLGGG